MHIQKIPGANQAAGTANNRFLRHCRTPGKVQVTTALLEEHPRGVQEPAQEVEGLHVELGGGQLGDHLLRDDEEDGDHSEAAVVELGVLLGDELVLRQLGPWASRKGGARDQQKAILLLRNLDTRIGGHANVSMCLYECDAMEKKKR